MARQANYLKQFGPQQIPSPSASLPLLLFSLLRFFFFLSIFSSTVLPDEYSIHLCRGGERPVLGHGADIIDDLPVTGPNEFDGFRSSDPCTSWVPSRTKPELYDGMGMLFCW